MTEAMPFLQKYDITFLRPPTITAGEFATGDPSGIIVEVVLNRPFIFAITGKTGVIYYAGTVSHIN